MEELIKITRGHLVFSIILAAILIILIYFYHSLQSPSIYIEQPETDKKTLLQTLQESNNIDAIKKVCSLYANCQDEHSAYISKFTDHMEKLLTQIAFGFILMLVVFCSGYYKILSIAKKIQNDQ